MSKKPGALTTSAASAKHLKRRRAADGRFRYYGLSAIVVALGALAVLAVTIGSQAMSAASYHVVSYEVTLDPAVIAPEGASRPEDISRNVDGFYSLVRDNLLNTFPEAGADRNSRREVSDFVTRLAVLPTARLVAGNPELIGSRISVTAPLNDDLDLYLKGIGVRERKIRAGAISSVEPAPEGAFQVSGAGAFNGLLAGLTVANEGRKDDAVQLDVLLTSGVSTGRLTEISADTAHLELLTGRVADFTESAPTARIIQSAESERTISNKQIAWTLALQDMGRIKRAPRWTLLTNSDSTYPELAGGLSAIVGSLLTMLVTALVAMPVGILAAVYLEEFAPRNRVTEFIEVNINNLAAVPSIVFGLLGAALFINFIGMPRSAPLVGGLVLALMTFPVVIIASRAALKSVPPSVRAGALAVGASQMQTVFHHVVPLAAPGILTGAILGMARALGETAPLLLIGMVAFVGDVPKSPMDESTVMPVLIFSWSNNAERAWEPLTAAMIVILLAFLLLMNGLVVFLRRKYERRW
ncbi:MAG: phosphate ABC transporter permease PstA [Hyphomonas sp.]|uniref:phosphate ABC transporter permease PstA n=1 Tax=Hyphomonas sp. TaxID=87 RepID=UPI0017E9D4FA|nr:phosphate ABC transporter permease PstA [Hyphomonas sp.]MBU3921219.1 phosphate ABC transporter permease PstA [Alphaproteobacteria bacterium]MBA3067169.1 phosphate ABC transporter permease PstA [Hyphomonas sp.]MBU4061221.1 phosphate ABC transporter permease PstA [Alphaproteobacteria bacterium]MBU4165133.1 phosphate ABC transporter permease PstA [Alphaproteobacteria bacterium]MBU4568688.1 phosphate ABC transporter permease PstA [Alphaproteobacteria bacterium]